MEGPNRCLITVIIFTIIVIGVVATTSLVMGFLIALSSSSSDNDRMAQPAVMDDNHTVTGYGDDYPLLPESAYEDPRIWLISLGEFDHKFEYLDDVTQQVRGFNVDIITTVCRLARKRCRLVFDDYSNCFNDGKMGRGLSDEYYDACTGWAVTYERLRSAAFTHSYAQASGSFFVTERGSSSGFDAEDLRGKKLGFLIGWDADEVCVNRLSNTKGLPLSDDQIAYYDDASDLSDALASGEIDAGFIVEDTFDPSRMERVSEETHACLAGQVSMMTRPTSRGLEFIEWWNKGLDQLLYSREYNEICDRLQTVHGNKAGGDKYDICLKEFIL